MKTRKQVLADFYGMQRQLCDKFGRGTIDVEAYDQGNGFWSVRIRVSRWSDELNAHDVWVDLVWTNYGTTHDEEYEAENEEALAEFKEKFNLK